MSKDRKTLQLCRQVEQALNLALADSHEPEILGQLAVLSVQPAPDGTHLSVLIGAVDPNVTIDPDEALGAVLSVSGRLRDEVARDMYNN